jgi:methylmalonyl-CoA/ethylmalonyl-CoA epimerase
MSSQVAEPFGRPVHHYGYVVAELEPAVDRLVRSSGAGPFFAMEHVALDTVISDDAPAVFDHSSAFGMCGPAFIELMEIHATAPERVKAGFDVTAPVSLHHVAWAVPDFDAATSGLELAGMPAWLEATLGDIHFSYHDATGAFGHHIEVHDATPGFQDFFAMMREAGEGWDGSEPLRSLAG